MKFYSEEKIAFYKKKAQLSLLVSICLVSLIKPCKRRMNHIYTVLHSSCKHLVCEVVEVNEVKTIAKDVVAKQLFVKTDNLELFINYNLDCAPRDFVVGSTIEVDVADSFIINEEN